MPATLSSGRKTTGPLGASLRKLWLAVGYSLTSCSTPSQLSVAPSVAAAEPAVQGAVAADDRARALERRVRVLGQRPVVDRARVEPPRGGQQRESAAHAEADHPHPAGAVGLPGQPRPGRLDVLEGAAALRLERGERRLEAAQGAAVAEEVGQQGEVTGSGQPVGLPARDVVLAKELVQHDHARPGSGCRRTGEVTPQAGGRARYGGPPAQVDVLTHEGSSRG